MKISTTFPRNYKAIKAILPAVAASTSCVFTYGQTIHNPHDVEMRPDLVVHEMVHAKQQKSPKDWWKRFLSDPEFRLSQELPAYAAQYQFARATLSSAKAKTVLEYLARDLSGEGYGNLVSYPRAESLIRHHEVV